MRVVSLIVVLSLWCLVSMAGGAVKVDRIDPPNWWVGMADTTLQLCLHGDNIRAAEAHIDYPGVVIVTQQQLDSKNYLFLGLKISRNALPGTFDIVLQNGKDKTVYPYTLSQKNPERRQGYDANDVVYLIMPDRFANGDKSNDIVKANNDALINRDSMFYRHGGDIKGITDHLYYLKDLGITTLWLTPIQENNQVKESYHGYAYTDHYKVDPRLGNIVTYQNLVKQTHGSGMKIIMDMVYNHIGNRHWWMKDLPAKDWIHQTDTFAQTNYRATALMDPYASAYDKNKMSNGWFVKSMPDLNQSNPYVAKYLIQNSLWWIETTGIDGFRIDTYSYSDLDFMAQLAHRIKQEYPTFTTIGEVWEHGVPIEAYWTANNKTNRGQETGLTGVTDFQLYEALNEALNKPMDWTGGLSRIYYTLAQDFVYENASNNLTFLDNHDLSRFYSVIGEDIRKYKMGIGFLLTTRGIPSIYYGTEILMKNFADPDGKVRSDFSGGWEGDQQNKFTTAGRNKAENEAFDYVKKLANYRKQSDALRNGKLIQFVPEKDTYVYFRSKGNTTVMVVMHYSDKAATLTLDRYKECIGNATKGTDVITDQQISLLKTMELQPNSISIIELN